VAGEDDVIFPLQLFDLPADSYHYSGPFMSQRDRNLGIIPFLDDCKRGYGFAAWLPGRVTMRVEPFPGVLLALPGVLFAVMVPPWR